MTILNKGVMSLALFAISVPAMAGNLYGTAQLGYSMSASDSEAYGNNIATDPTFKNNFDNEDSLIIGLGLGYQINSNFRFEARVAHRNHDIDDTNYGTGKRNGAEYILDGQFESTTFTLEGFYDFTTNTDLKPYVKAGVGMAKNDYQARLGGKGVAEFDKFDGTVDGYYDNYADGETTEFTWNLGLGVHYAISPKSSVFGEYQYASFGDVQTGQDSFTDGFKVDNASAHEIKVGMHYQF